MNKALSPLIQRPWMNDWKLLALIGAGISAAMVYGMLAQQMATPEGVSNMIALSVRCSVPWLCIAFAASSLHVLAGNDTTRWLLRNRKIFGLGFAVGMAWQGLFILWLVFGHSDYYAEEVYVLRDTIEGVIGYAFLIAMTITSFKPWRQRLTSAQWRRLHKWGIYFLWAYIFSVYWHALFYYGNPDAVDYLFYIASLGAFLLRVAAWSRKQFKQAARKQQDHQASVALPGLAWVMALIAAFAMVTGGLWQEAGYEYLYGYTYTAWLDLYVPYWPPLPFLPLLLMALAAACYTRGKLG